MIVLTWLREQLDEDERVARATSGVSWNESVPGAIHVDAAAIRENKRAYGTLGHVATVEHDEYRAHMARWDPARVLAEVEAKRRIVEIHRVGWSSGEPEYSFHFETTTSGKSVDVRNDEPDPPYWCNRCHEFAPCGTVRALALPYADRPGYQSEWAPEQAIADAKKAAT